MKIADTPILVEKSAVVGGRVYKNYLGEVLLRRLFHENTFSLSSLNISMNVEKYLP